MTLWPLFGATNQCLAGLALIVITIYLKKRGGASWILSGLPALFMVVMTTWGLIMNEINFVAGGKWLLVVINAAVLFIAVWMTIEGLAVFAIGKAGTPAAEAEA